MKLWDGSDKSRSQISEKWIKLFEVRFDQGKTSEEPEHIVDYEVINSQLIEGGNGFLINLVVLTSFNQYLVYETQTTLLDNLKTLSQTKVLFHVFTQDCPLSLLASCQFNLPSIEKGALGTRTVLALLTEVDPLRQRKEARHQKEVVPEPEEDSFGEDESEEDDDIFAQFTGGSKKKTDMLTLKKKPAPVV